MFRKTNREQKISCQYFSPSLPRKDYCKVNLEYLFLKTSSQILLFSSLGFFLDDGKIRASLQRSIFSPCIFPFTTYKFRSTEIFLLCLDARRVGGKVEGAITGYLAFIWQNPQKNFYNYLRCTWDVNFSLFI